MDLLVDLLIDLHGPLPYLLVFGVLLACGLGLPIPEDITLFAAGLMAYYGIAPLSAMIVLSFVGVILGDSIVFLLGHRFGRQLTKQWFFHKLLPDDRLDAVKEKFHTRGDKLLFAARFMPGFRAPVYFSAGTLHIPFKKFIFYDGLAALISVPAIVGAVYYFGDELDQVVRVIKKIEHGIFFVIVAAILAMAVKWYISHRKIDS